MSNALAVDLDSNQQHFLPAVQQTVDSVSADKPQSGLMSRLPWEHQILSSPAFIGHFLSPIRRRYQNPRVVEPSSAPTPHSDL